MTKVLVIEDEPDVRDLLTLLLERADYQVEAAADGVAGLRAFHSCIPDVVLLDVNLPAMDGWEVLERIRVMADTPVIMLTAHSLEAEKIRGLDAGADDYVTKPFGSGELISRINASVRRAARPAGTPSRASRCFSDGRLEVDFAASVVRVDGDEVPLTRREYRLLAALVGRAGQVCSPEELLDEAWDDPSGIGADKVKYCVMRLRRKIGQPGDSSLPIESLRGLGYRYVVQ